MQASMIADYKEVIGNQKNVIASAEASLKASAAELQQVRAERDKRGKIRLKAIITGTALV